MNKVAQQSNAIKKSHSQARKGFMADIEELTEDNSDFRRVLYTGKNLQLVLMAIQPGDVLSHTSYHSSWRLALDTGGLVNTILDGITAALDLAGWRREWLQN